MTQNSFFNIEIRQVSTLIFPFFYIWNQTLKILVNKALGINLRAFMDTIVKNDVTMLIKVTTHKTFKDGMVSG